ncbi:MAG: cobalamin-dependent protein, partial [Phycisphaerae bacterium]|nr:cobalamin-dependent protein [Phycisphaerae bacterium]
MRVLLIPQKSNYPSLRPCLDLVGQGFPYLAGALRAAGHEVFAANINYRWCQGSAAAELERTIRRGVADFQPQLIGLGGLSADYPFIRQAMRICRETAGDVPVVCGGGIMTYDAEYIFGDLRPDFGIVGEAEETIVSLVDAIAAGGGFDRIANLCHWRNGQAVHNPIGEACDNLDDL